VNAEELLAAVAIDAEHIKAAVTALLAGGDSAVRAGYS
jgi:hypothetical protein